MRDDTRFEPLVQVQVADQPALECDDCGTVIRHLTGAEEARVAANPYNFIAYCGPCRRYHQGRAR